jgi:hypothetical protein
MLAPEVVPSSPAARPPRLLDRLTDALRTRGYVPALRQAYESSALQSSPSP